MADFEAARDRVLMGQRRESVMLSEKEKEATAFHEGGHALCAYVLPNADPVHKVTILPTGMALGVTQQLPLEERHTYWREYLDDSLAVLMGGRCAEQLIMGSLSTGGGSDLQRATELARKMVREFGMSDRIGPMAWGSEGAVFLGEDLMQTRDYSDETSRVIDEEVEKILRSAEERSAATLAQYRTGLEAIAHALLEKETINGAEVARLVDSAIGHPVHPTGPKSTAIPRFVDRVDRPGSPTAPRPQIVANGGQNAHGAPAAQPPSPSHPQPATPAPSEPAGATAPGGSRAHPPPPQATAPVPPSYRPDDAERDP
jgi:cell division protease FtsH